MDPYSKLAFVSFIKESDFNDRLTLDHLNKEQLLQFFATQDGNEIFHRTCSKGWYDVSIRLIEEFGLDPNVQNQYGDTALHKASKSSSVELVKKLISSYNCDPLLPNLSGNTPLHCAIIARKHAMASAMMEAIISCCGCGSTNHTLVSTLAWEYWNESIIKCFMNKSECGLGILAVLLHKCFTSKRYDRLDFILDKCDFKPKSVKDNNGDTLLHICVSMGFSELFCYLIINDYCKPGIKNDTGETPLNVICCSLSKQGYSRDKAEMLFFLLKKIKTSPYIESKNRHISILPIVCEAINSNDNFDPSMLRYLIIDCGWDLGNHSSLILQTLCNAISHWRCIHILFELVLKIDPYLYVAAEDYREVCTMCFPTPYQFTTNFHQEIIAYSEAQVTFLENVRRFIIRDYHFIEFNILSKIVDIFDFFFRNINCPCNFCSGIIKCVQELYFHATYSLGLALLRQLVRSYHFVDTNFVDDPAYHDLFINQLNKMCATSNEISFRDSVLFHNPLHSAIAIICWLEQPLSSNIYSLFYNLINSSELTGNLTIKADIFGNTLLHLACLFYHGDSTLIEYLLSTGKTDLLCINDYQQTPLTLLALSSKATDNELNIQDLVNKFGEMKISHPIESYVNIVVLGDPGVGKSTLVKVINDRHDVLLRQFRSVTGVELHTAGIVPHIINDKDMGRIIIHDLAGQVEYYSSHTAVLGNLLQGSAAVFIVVISLADESSTKSLQFWLSVVENASSKAFKKHHMFVVVSHCDTNVPTRANKFSKLQIALSAKLKSLSVIYHDNIFRLDCRKLGGGQLNSLMASLADACESVRRNNVRKMSLYCHMLYDFLHSHGKAVYSLNDLVQAIKETYNCFLPTGTDQLINIIQSLSLTGLIMYLRKRNTPAEDLWIIADKAVLLKNLNGVLFAPDDFKEHVDQLVSKTGIVKLSELFDHCNLTKYGYDPDMIVQFLESMELSHEISKKFFLSSNLEPFSESMFNESRYLFIPALIKNSDRPDNADQFHFGWCLQCSDVHSFFLSLFIHLIILHLLKYTDDRSPDDPIDRHCHIWNNGIYWSRRDGVSALVELFDKHKTCVLLMSFESGCYDKMSQLRKTLIREILSCQSQVLLKASIKEFVLDNTNGLQYPQILEAFSDVALYSIHEFSRCYKFEERFVLEHKNIQRREVNDLLKGTDIKEQCESVLAGRNPENLSEIDLSCTEYNGAEGQVNVCGSIPSSNTHESNQTHVLSQAQQNSTKPLDSLQGQPPQHPSHSEDSDLNPSYVFNLLKGKASKWDAIGRELGVSLDNRDSFRRDVSLNDDGRLERVVDMWVESRNPTSYRDQFITALRNLQYHDVLTTVLNNNQDISTGPVTEIPGSLDPPIVSSRTNLPTVSPKTDALSDVLKWVDLPQQSPDQLIYQGHSDTTVIVSMKHHCTTTQLSVDPNEQDRQPTLRSYQGVNDMCNPILHPTDGLPWPTDTLIVYSVLLKYKPRLLGIIANPNKLAVELVAKDLISQHVQDHVSTTVGISRFDKADIIMNEVVRSFEQCENDRERFLKFCQVLKDHGQPGLDELAEEMKKKLQ